MPITRRYSGLTSHILLLRFLDFNPRHPIPMLTAKPLRQNARKHETERSIGTSAHVACVQHHLRTARQGFDSAWRHAAQNMSFCAVAPCRFRTACFQ